MDNKQKQKVMKLIFFCNAFCMDKLYNKEILHNQSDKQHKPLCYTVRFSFILFVLEWLM